MEIVQKLILQAPLVFIRGIYKQEWRCVYGNFPPTHIMLQGYTALIPNYIQPIFQAARSLFSLNVCEKYLEILNAHTQRNSIDLMNDVVAMSFGQLSINKGIFDNEFGRLRQIRLFLNMSFSCPEIESSTYIHSNFAYFNGDKDAVISNKCNVNHRSFNPSSVYPTAQEDALLYFIFIGGVNGNWVPTGYFFNQQN